MKKEMNCWDFKECGLGPDDDKINKIGICPAARAEILDGVHHGKSGGRACWVVPGTFCGGEAQGEFVQKYSTCMNCDFYQIVREEEGPKFQITLLLMKRFKAA